MSSETIVIKRLSKRRLEFWLKTIFTLGIWSIWWKNNYLALTKRSIIRHSGVFNREERAVPLNQVQNITIEYGVIRHLLGHGDVRIETAAEGVDIVMKNIDKPEDFRALVFKQIDEFYGDDTHQPGTDKPKTS